VVAVGLVVDPAAVQAVVEVVVAAVVVQDPASAVGMGFMGDRPRRQFARAWTLSLPVAVGPCAKHQ